MRIPIRGLLLRFRRTGSHEPLFVLLLFMVPAAIWLFAELAEGVSEGTTTTLDSAILLAMRAPGDLSDPIGPPWFEELMRDFTALGSSGILALMTIAVIGLLYLQSKHRAALMVAAAVFGGMIVSNILKELFSRPRPDLVPHHTLVLTSSFPSGHSMMAAVVYLTLGTLLARLQARRRLKAYILCVAIFVTLLVGISRVYLGVHWPTDVLAGWTIGAAWAGAFWLLTLLLQSQGSVEPSGEEQRSEA